MATTPLKTLKLRPSKAPNLPIAPVEYRQQYVDQLNNALRLYFNEIDNYTGGLLAVNGGGLLKFPYGSFHQDGTTVLTANMTNVSTTPIQVVSTAGFPTAGYLLIEDEILVYTGVTPTTFTGITRGVKSSTNVAHTAGVDVTEAQGVAANTVSVMLMTSTDFSNNVYLDSPTSSTRIYTDYSGIYNVQFSSQFLNYATSVDDVTIWTRVNGVDVPFSAGIVQIGGKHGSSPGANIVGWNIYLQLNAGDYFELVWATGSGNTILATYPAGTAPIHPVSPSTILSATFVSALPS